jgi:hypothetical protein
MIEKEKRAKKTNVRVTILAGLSWATQFPYGMIGFRMPAQASQDKGSLSRQPASAGDDHSMLFPNKRCR